MLIELGKTRRQLDAKLPNVYRHKQKKVGRDKDFWQAELMRARASAGKVAKKDSRK